MSKTRSNKGETFPPDTLTAEEVQRLMAACSKRGLAGIRQKALVCLLWRSGLRISEALALKPKDIDHDKGQVRVMKGKGGKYRIAGIDPGALAVLDTWLDKRKGLGLNGKHPIFCTITEGNMGKPLATSYIRRKMAQLREKAGIEKRVHAHGLRHTHASELREESVEIGIISKQLGHSSIATTARYLDHVNPAAVVETVHARSW